MFVFITKDPADANIGFELDAVDCLLQPFSFQRFLKTTEKIERRISAAIQKITATHAQPELQYCFVKTDQNFVKVEFQKICYVEGVENYIRIYCENKTVMALNTMKNIETALSSHHFLRIHRSYIVNLDKVERILNHNFYVGEKVLPIGKSYRKPITDILKQSYTIGC
jgi:DNA-binding LytR/AlgR family response regulator